MAIESRHNDYGVSTVAIKSKASSSHGGPPRRAEIQEREAKQPQ